MNWRILIIGQVLLGYLIILMPGTISDPYLQKDSSPQQVTSKANTRLKSITLYGIERQRNEDDSKAVAEALKYFESKGIKAFQYSSKEEMVNEVLRALTTAGKGSCIQQLNLYGHGTPGIFNTGNGPSAHYRESTFIAFWNPREDSRNDWRSALIKLKGKFCGGAVLSIRGCNVGADEEGAKLLYQMADYFKIRVEAPVDWYIVPNYNGLWQVANHKMSGPPPPKSSTDRIFRRRQHRRVLFPEARSRP